MLFIELDGFPTASKVERREEKSVKLAGQLTLGFNPNPNNQTADSLTSRPFSPSSVHVQSIMLSKTAEVAIA